MAVAAPVATQHTYLILHVYVFPQATPLPRVHTRVKCVWLQTYRVSRLEREPRVHGRGWAHGTAWWGGACSVRLRGKLLRYGMECEARPGHARPTDWVNAGAQCSMGRR